MCGLTGFWGADTENTPAAYEIARKMATAIRRRGPDDEGVWQDPCGGPLLAHRRLSIVDLSVAGHQPMLSATGRFVIAFNGEIYNHMKLRASLEEAGEPVVWRGHSDTETLLAGIEAWGLHRTLQKCIGMFAIALWDRYTRVLNLARDRLGEKPLYYGVQNGVFLFGSELTALKAHPAFMRKIDRDALELLMRHNYIPAPYAIYRGIHKLLPGHVLTLSSPLVEPLLQPYWQARTIIEQGLSLPFAGTPCEAVEALELLLKDAVAQQMVADVPLGAFLSGGVDSSSIVALMQAQSSQPVRTFSIGFGEAGYDEAKYAKLVAKHLGTEHTELYITSKQAIEVIPDLPKLYSEPFADSSQVPTFLVSQMARQHVTVALSGDGGDELFAGYARYKLVPRLWSKFCLLPTSLRRILAAQITNISPSIYSGLARRIQYCLPSKLASSNWGDKVHKGASLMSASSPDELYRVLISHWPKPEELVLGASEQNTLQGYWGEQPSTDGLIHQMMALDLLTYLPDDLLCKVDRAAMAVSLETRVPLLDPRIVEFAWTLPLTLKIRNRENKWILRQVLHKYVPRSLIDRPKMGFAIPLANWLRGSLRDWAEDLLEPRRLRQEGYLDPIPIQQKWAEHLSGKRNWQSPLWNVLMFQAWLAAEV